MNAKIQAVDHPNAYGANQAGANALNATLSAGIGAYQKEWLKDFILWGKKNTGMPSS